jgi:hypothetical protein
MRKSLFSNCPFGGGAYGLTATQRGKAKRLSSEDGKLLDRRNVIEPILGHLNAEHRLDRSHLKGEVGDRLHAVLCAAGYNPRWLLRMILKKGLRAVLWLSPGHERYTVRSLFSADRTELQPIAAIRLV